MRKFGNHLIFNIQMYEAISPMAQATIVKIRIEGEKCRTVILVQEGDYLVIFHSFAANIVANLPDGDTPALQQGSLTLGDVLIQDIHAGRDSWAYFAACSSKVR